MEVDLKKIKIITILQSLIFYICTHIGTHKETCAHI